MKFDISKVSHTCQTRNRQAKAMRMQGGVPAKQLLRPLLPCRLYTTPPNTPCTHTHTCNPQTHGKLLLSSYLCEMVFLMSLSISAYVSWKPSGWKTGSQPKSGGPRAGTMAPSVRPTNVMGSASGPAGYGVCAGQRKNGQRLLGVFSGLQHL